MIIPYQTEAPGIYRPWGTMLMILLNGLVFALMMGGVISPQARSSMWVLHYNDGFDPLQILTSMFSHADAGHLLGNMIFLWVFGQLIEGRMRCWSFMGLYISTGLLTGLFELILMSGSDGGSLGASSAISALMITSIIWTPLNRVDCLLLWYPYIRRYDFPVYGIAAYYVGWDLVSTLFLGFNQNSTPLLHTLGALAGLIPAIALLKMEWVDCEGWDLLSIWKHGNPQRRKHKNQVAREDPDWCPPREQKAVQALGLFRQAMLEGNILMAYDVLQQQVADGTTLELVQREQNNLVQGLIRQHHYTEAETVLEHFHQRSPDDARLLLQLAWLHIVHLNQADEGLRLLSKVRQMSGGSQLMAQAHALEERARKLLPAGQLTPQNQ